MAARRHSSIFGPAFAEYPAPAQVREPALLPTPPISPYGRGSISQFSRGSISPFSRQSMMWSTLDDMRARACDDIAPDQMDPRTMGRFPSTVLQDVFEHLDRKDLFNVLVASKAMYNEVQKVLYHTLTLSPDVSQPLYISPRVAPMVRAVKIQLGNPYRAAKHTKWCMELLPRLKNLESIEITGRGWDVSVFESCLPRPWDSYEGITGIRSFKFEGNIDLPLIRFLAAQHELTELEISSSINVPFSSAEVLEAVKRPYPYLSKVTIPHEFAKAIIPLAPVLRHLALSFDSTTTSFDLSKTFTQLPPTIESLVLNTTRRDFLSAHAFLPRSLRMLSTVFVAEDSTLLLQYLTPLKHLEHVILNVCQVSVPSFINPFAMGGDAGAGVGPSPSVMQGVSDVTVDGFISKLKSLCPTIKSVEVDDQVFQRKGSVWHANDGGRMLRKEIYDITRHCDGSAARKWSISH
ncbi:hypothetical protein FRC17_004989 [Serendipita sp. 399]|nr:hypothetical protein FRC17_004989 [Serendipita sp. 399]